MATKIPVPTAGDVITGGAKAFDDLAGLIANPPANRPLEAAIGSAGRKYCDFIGALPGNASGLLGLGLPLQALLCKPYWDGAGYSAPVVNPPPFSGGQCVGASYTVRVNVFIDGVNQGGPFPFTGTGPFLGARRTDTGNVQRWDMVFASGAQQIGSSGTSQVWTITYVSVVRNGGLPDNCGNLPGVIGPGPNPPPTPTFPAGQQPGVEPTGQPFFFVPPITPPIPGNPVDVPDPPYEMPPTGGGGPTVPPVAGDEESGSDGDNEFGAPPAGERWVGCCIALGTLPVGTGTVPGTSPETVLTQVVGNARLLFDSATGDSYDTPVQIRSAGLCLWEPVKGLSPKGVRVNLKPGFTFSYTPYSVPGED